jgi:hypothetical protein
MVETVKKPSSNRSAKERRNTLFRVLYGVLSLSHKKIHAGGNSDWAKQGWARVLVSAVSTYGGLLKDGALAKVSAFVIAKAVRRTNKRFIAVTCHYDVLDWLEPDWVFYTDDMSFSKKGRRPKIEVSIHPCTHSFWRLFRNYHY